VTIRVSVDDQPEKYDDEVSFWITVIGEGSGDNDEDDSLMGFPGTGLVVICAGIGSLGFQWKRHNRRATTVIIGSNGVNVVITILKIGCVPFIIT